MTQILVTGSRGQLGRAVTSVAENRELDVTGHDIDTVDLTDRGAVADLVARIRPRTVVNCAAFTAVDRAEEEETAARRVNATAVEHLAESCSACDARLIHVSTDYVFPGDGARPYREDDPLGPRSAYGRTKLLGEHAARKAPHHLVVRTAWLFGHGGRNFVEAIRRQLRGDAGSVRVVDDQIGSPTFAGDLAEAVLDLDRVGATGVVHAVNSGVTSWFGFAREIARLLGSDTPVIPVSSEELPRPAPRPRYSVLDTSRLELLIGRPMPDWRDALARYLETP